MSTWAVGAASPVVERLPEWAQFPGVQLVLALLVVFGGVWLAKLLVRLLGRPVAHRFTRQSVAQTVLRGVRVFTVVSAFALAAWILGVEMPQFVISVAVFSAVVGVILAPLIGSVINGVFVLWDQPFEIGDMIELDDGTQGFVEDITIRYTKVFTLDNTFLVIPNANMRDRDITNYSAEDERTRLSLDMLVTYEGDVEVARNIMERAARDCEVVIDGGPDIRVGTARYSASPECRVREFADDGILLRLRYWAKKPYKIHKIQSQVNERIWELVADADVEMAYPHRHLVFDDTSGTAQVGVDRSDRDGDDRDGDDRDGDDRDGDDRDGDDRDGDGVKRTRSEDNRDRATDQHRDREANGDKGP